MITWMCQKASAGESTHTSAPRLASSSVIPSPRPRDPPVIIAVLPCSGSVVWPGMISTWVVGLKEIDVINRRAQDKCERKVFLPAINEV